MADFSSPIAGASACFGPPTHTIDLGHSRVPVWTLGRGPHLVFVHGWPLHAATFRALVARWSARFTCHVFDLPGAGGSEWSERSEIGLAEHGHTTRAVVDALGLDAFALVAHDSGGVFARHAAADNPRVRGLVLGNTEIPGYASPLVKLLLLSARLPGAAALFRHSLRSRRFRRSRLGFGGCFADAAHAEGEFSELFVTPILRDRRVFEGQMRLVRNFDPAVLRALEEVHARIQAPTLLVWGAEDPFFPLAPAREMMPQFAGGAELVVLSPGKLFVHEERPDDFAAAAEPFLQRCFE